MTLPYVGRAPDSDSIIVPKSYADAQATGDALTSSWVTTAAQAQFPNLTTQSYVDTQDALRAHKTDVSAADANYVAATLLGQVNGVASLDSSGDIVAAQIGSALLTDRVLKAYSLKTVVPAFDAAGAGFRKVGGTATSGSWSHTVGANANCVVFAGSFLAGGTALTLSATFGGQAMTFVGSQAIINSSVNVYDVAFFILMNPPTGAQTGTFTFAGGSPQFVALNTFSYTGVGGWHNLTGNQGTTVSGTITVPSATDELVLTCFCVDGTNTSGWTAPASTAGTISTRYSVATVSNEDWATAVYESPGASSVTVTATAPDAAGYGVVGISLQPSNPTGAVGSVLFTGEMTIAGTATPQQMASITIPDPGYPWRPVPLGFVGGDSSGATKPSVRTSGTGCYGLLTVAPDPSVSTQVYGLGICTGSWFTNAYPFGPYCAAGQTPTSVPPITGGMELYLYGSVWSGTTYTFYATGLSYSILVAPAL